MFPPGDLCSGPCTPFIICIPHILAAFLVIKINSFYETCIPKVGVAMLVYWMMWYCYCFLSCFRCTFSCIVQYSLYHNMDIGTMWHCTLNNTPSQSMVLFFACALFWCWVSLGTPVTISLIEFCFIMISIKRVVTTIGIFMAINYFLNYTLGFLYLSSSGSANAQLRGCFRPWIFSLNIGLNMLPLDSFMSCLHSLLGYSTGEFRPFGAVD